MFYEKNKIVEIIISWFFIDNSIRLKMFCILENLFNFVFWRDVKS